MSVSNYGAVSFRAANVGRSCPLPANTQQGKMFRFGIIYLTDYELDFPTTAIKPKK